LDVSFLSTLRFFVLTRESVGGPFPDWSRLTTLENVLVNSNNLNGSFPAFLISQNPLLGTLHIDRNSFQGVLPPFSESTSLSDLRLYDNDFTGPIVPEIANLKSLSMYRFHDLAKVCSLGLLFLTFLVPPPPQRHSLHGR
jgi:hypothetical protein